MYVIGDKNEGERAHSPNAVCSHVDVFGCHEICGSAAVICHAMLPKTRRRSPFRARKINSAEI